MTMIRNLRLMMACFLGSYATCFYGAELNSRFELYMSSINKLMAGRELQDRKLMHCVSRMVNKACEKCDTQSELLENELKKNNERYQKMIHDLRRFRKNPDNKEFRVCRFLMDLFDDSEDEGNEENSEAFDQMTCLLERRDLIRNRQDMLNRQKKSFRHIEHEFRRLRERSEDYRRDHLYQLELYMSDFRQAMLSEKIVEIQSLVQLKRKNKINQLKSSNPTAYHYYQILLKKMTIVLDTYMILATGKIALATDKTSQAAQILGSAIKNIPGTHSLGSGVQAGIVAGKHLLRDRRIQTVYKSFESRESVSVLSEWVCLKLILSDPESWEHLDQKKEEKRSEQVVRDIYHMISDGTLLKFQRSSDNTSDTGAPVSDQMEDLSEFLIREYQKKASQKQSFFRRSFL